MKVVMLDPLDKIMGSMPSVKKNSSSSGGQKSSWADRIPKRVLNSRDQGEPSSKKSVPSCFTAPAGRGTFNELESIDVQMNMFTLNLSKMPDKLQRFHVDTFIQCSNGKEINMNLGYSAASGDVNSHNRRLGQHTLMRKFHQKRRQIFSGRDYHCYVYDCSATLYAPCDVYIGEDEEECTFKKKDFSSEEWAIVSRLTRRKDDAFLMRIKPAGIVYTHGDNVLEPSNRLELTRCVEIVTSQKLNTSDFYQFGNLTFPLQVPPQFEPDSTSEIRTGFAKVARIGEGRNGAHEMFITIDNKLSPFVKSIPVTQFARYKYAEMRGIDGCAGGAYSGRPRARDSRDSRDSRDPITELASRLENNDNTRRIIEQALKGLYVEPTHLKDSSMNLIRITGLGASSAENTKFEMKRKDGEARTLTVSEYFCEMYNIKLKYPQLPLVISKRFKSECFYPMELLNIAPGQRIKLQKMSSAVQSAMTGNKALKPFHHIQKAKDVLERFLRLEHNGFMDAFGVQFTSNTPVHLKAKLLPPAQIRFKNQVCVPEMCRPAFWSRSQSRFVDPAHINIVGVIVFDNAVDERQSRDFCNRLFSYCRECGIEVDQPTKEWPIRFMNSNDNVGIKEIMGNWKDNGFSIIVGITREKKPDVHDILKYYEESVGMQTIQLCKQTIDKMMDRRGRQTIDNVMRKFNLKCGGTNFFLEIPPSIGGKSTCANLEGVHKKLFEHTQFLGFEISHGAARSLYDRSRGKMDGEPSIVGVSYSLKNSTQLGGLTYMQTQKEYKLQKLDEVFPKCITSYKEHAKKLPDKVVIYRVGVGEGDFKRINEEIEEMRETFDKIQPGYRPNLVVIIAQRASHTRIYRTCINERDKAEDQNIPAGTCIDNVVTSFGYEEFILSSQIPLIGTVRPCKYTIIVNDPKWTKNEIMHLTYFRAFGHQVSYQPPSVPDVLYAAENLAKRGRNNYKVHQRFVNLQSVERRVISDHAELIDEEMREQLAAAIIDEMSIAMNGMTISKRNFWA